MPERERAGQGAPVSRRSGGGARRAPRRSGAGRCPRCDSRLVEKIPIWAIIVAILLFPIGLLALLAKEKRCPRGH